MGGFKRLFVANPGFNVLGNIESVNVIDVAPPATPLGAGTGVTAVIGEFERGVFNAPSRVSGGTDMENQFGGFGYTYNGVPYQHPVARRSGQSATAWNGSGFVNLRNKRFAGLIVVRVDNSAGNVSFTRRASLVGGSPSFLLASGSTLALSLNGGAPVIATFTGTRGTITGSSGTFPTLFTGGETLGLRIDDNPEIVVIFQAGDQSLTQVVDRINNTAAQVIASESGGELQLQSSVSGQDGSIEVSSGSARGTLGLPTAAVQQVYTSTVTNTSAGPYTLRAAVTNDGVTTNYDVVFALLGTESNEDARTIALNAFLALGVPGVTFATAAGATFTATADDNVSVVMTTEVEPTGSDITHAQTTAGVFTKLNGTGNVSNLSTVTAAEVGAIVGAISNIEVDLDPDGNLRIANTSTSPLASIAVDASSTAAVALGLTLGQSGTASSGAAGTIAAGTRVLDTTNNTLWVTIEDMAVPATLNEALDIKVRPATDDDSTPTCAIGDASVLVDSLEAAWSVSNTAALSRLTAAQMDARYLEAIDSTVDVSGVAYDTNIIFSARTSANIMRALRSNATGASATGHRTRKAVVAPPVGTTRAVAQGSAGVGVGAVGREQRVSYLFPGLTTLIPEIATVGAAGGTGFTDNGVVQLRSDGFFASVASILPPEENRGQQLSDTNYGALNALNLENAYNRSTGGLGLEITDYQNFRAAGVIAPRNDRAAGLVFQSDVTSVDPAIQPSLADNKRRYMGDFIIDTLTDIAAGYVKKLNTPQRRRAFIAAVNAFLNILRAETQPDFQRIADYSVVDDTTEEQRGLGFQILAVKVRILPSMDFIVYRTEVGTTVTVDEL